MLSALRKLCSSDQPPITTHSTPGSVGSLPAISHTLSLPAPQPIASTTGPEDGISHLVTQLKDWPSAPSFQPAAGTSGRLSGVCASLYDKDPDTGGHNGDPIADCFGALGFHEGALLALADGVNWGVRPRNAAYAAVYGFLRHMHGALASLQDGGAASSDNVLAHLVAAATQSAQQLVIQQNGTLTTLVGALVCPLAKQPSRWGVLALAIGDSPAYVWRHAMGEVEEITYVQSGLGEHRNPRMCPGALGFALGEAPDLSNLLCCVTSIEDDDVVFLMSDGVSDNFDPILRKEATEATPPLITNAATTPEPATPDALPALDPAAAHTQALHTMSKVLRGAGSAQQAPLNAQQLCRALLEHVDALTAPQRALIERAGKAGAASDELVLQVRAAPGKLDHATVVAYQAGKLPVVAS